MITTSLIITLVITYFYISGAFVGFWFILVRNETNWRNYNYRNKWTWLLIISYLILVGYINWLIFSRLAAVVNQQIVNQIFSYLVIALMWIPLAFGLCLLIWIISQILIELIKTLTSNLNYLHCNYRWWFWIKHWKWTKQTFKPFYQNYLKLRKNNSFIRDFYLFQTTKTSYSVNFNVSWLYGSIILQSNQLNDFVNLDFYQRLSKLLNTNKDKFTNLESLIWDYQSKQIHFVYQAQNNLLISYQVDQDPLTFLETKFLNCFDHYNQIYQIFKTRVYLKEPNASIFNFVQRNLDHLNWSHLKINGDAQKLVWQYQSKHNLQVYQEQFSLIESELKPTAKEVKIPHKCNHRWPLQVSEIDDHYHWCETKIGDLPTTRFNKGVKND